MAHSQTTIYFFAGQGSDKRIFDSLDIDPKFKKIFIEYPVPKRGTSLKQFAKELSVQIDTTQPFILLGVSLGGMICCEMTEYLHPQKVIIISSAKTRKELPFRYKFQRYIPLYAILPAIVLRGGAKLMQPIVEPDRNKNKKTFKAMLHDKKPKFIKRTIRMIVNWKKKESSTNIYHIHGTKDHTLPYRKLKNIDYTISKGSHMMTLTRAEEISKVFEQILEK
ncbi:MAG: alpha/beta hydrolase [Bacteroidota bacterium]|nr:alpha/beta hydrolase [Bacteroidota bacterium]